jgi:hypothetical protein
MIYRQLKDGIKIVDACNICSIVFDDIILIISDNKNYDYEIVNLCRL